MIYANEMQAYIGGVCVRGPTSVMNRALNMPRQTFWKWLTSGINPGETIYLNQSILDRFTGGVRV